MKRALLSLFAALWLAVAALAPVHSQVSVDPTKIGTSYPASYTWATKPAATSLPAGTQIRITDIGTDGTMWFSTGTRYKLVGGKAIIKGLGNSVSGIANSETIVMQALMPAGAVQTNDTVRVWVTATKSGTTDSATMIVHVGTAGTTADTTVVSNSIMGAANRTYGGIFDLKLTSATGLTRSGANSANGSYTVSNSAAGGATAITDASANALYWTVTLQSSSTNDTVGSIGAQFELVTP